MNQTAILSNKDGYTVFKFGQAMIRIAAPYSLLKYVRVKKWDNGYLVVDADYSTLGTTEEYIDIRDALNELYIDADRFLRPIKKVEIGT